MTDSDNTPNISLQGRMSHEQKEATQNAVSVKIPPFYPDNPEWWFSQVECAFAVSGITRDETKYSYVVMNLDKTVMPLIWDVVSAPPTHLQYETLKERILSTFSESNETKLRRLLRGQELGNEKPSFFLQKLRTLAAGQYNNEVLKTIFFEQLPENVKGILAVSDTIDLSWLALQVDKIMDALRPVVASCATTSSKEQPKDDTLEYRIQALEKAMRTRLGRRDKKKPTRRSRSNSRKRSQSKERPKDVCYYHHKFGNDAKKCTRPCRFDQIPLKEN